MTHLNYKEFVPVGAGHELFVERYGKRGGIPVLFIHGGPGAGYSEEDKKLFNRDVYDVLFFDQRGAGRSRYRDIASNNTTAALLDDIDTLLQRFSITRPILFAGSWGTTLALLYSIRRPTQVSKLILRGLFLADDESIKYFYKASQRVMPTILERFLKLVPNDHRGNPAEYYWRQISQGEEPSLFIQEWARYELSIGSMKYSEDAVEKLLVSRDFKSFSSLGALFFANRFFLNEGEIRKGLSNISHIPLYLVHGALDLVASAVKAKEVAGQFRNAKYIETAAGHSITDEANYSALKKILHQIETQQF
jgi:proline iminopeptidase